MTSPLLHATVTLTTTAPGVLSGRAVGPIPVTGGDVTLDALGVPYATAQLEVPFPDGAALADLDPRDDVRVLITAGNTGHWVNVPATYTPWTVRYTNLAVNPSFESGAAIPAGGSISTAWAASGSRSLYVPYPAAGWGVIPDTTDGVQPITAGGHDLEGTTDDGIFTLPPGTRFVQTAEPGIYVWSP